MYFVDLFIALIHRSLTMLNFKTAIKQIINTKNYLMLWQNSLVGEDIIQMYKPYINNTTKWKRTVVNKEIFNIDDRYQIIEPLSPSSNIVSAYDRGENEKNAIVVIKKINRISDHKIFAKRLLRQLKMLRILRHENIVDLKTILLPKSREHFDEIYLVFGVMDINFRQIIRSDNELTEDHNKFFLYQILRALKYIHSADVVHRDLTTRNILVTANCDLKICNFGLSRCLHQQIKSKIMTEYMTNRWYRSPEILLNVQNYSKSIDMWSVGCIFAEMLLRRSFLTGTDTKNQIKLICQYFSQELSNMPNINEPTRKMIKQILDDKPNLKDIRQQFSFADPKAVDLLEKMLTVDPNKRITALEALRHPYLQELHLQEDEPTAEQVNCLEFQFEDYNLNTQQLKDLLYEQILLYHFKEFYIEYEKKKANNQSLIKHILQNSNSKNFDPYTDSDN